MKEKEQILGVDVSITSYDQLEQDILHDIDNNKKSFIVAINPEKLRMARLNSSFKELLNSATYNIPDGSGIIMISKLRKGKIRTRVTGIDLMMRICRLAAEHNKSIFMYGGKPEVLEQAKEKLQSQIPTLKIAGAINGYEKDQEKIKEEINKSGADIIFVALGSPKQELWIWEHMNDLCPKIFQGVGGSFDVLSGQVLRAPLWMQKISLEWFYRLIKQPWRFKRILNVFKIMAVAIFEKNPQK
jgi:N-acetylglucosaminyldiphosphoundecaprenol N-acetyl-beta-D-mannosaminyltransferase